MNETTRKYLSFRVGHQWYGVDVYSAVEVMNFIALTELPATAPDVLGLMTVRDTVMPVIDLRIRFGMSQAPLRLNTPIVAVRASNGPIGLVVDDADAVEEVPVEQIAAYDSGESPYVTAIARLPTRLLLLLDTSLLRQETHLS